MVMYGAYVRSYTVMYGAYMVMYGAYIRSCMVHVYGHVWCIYTVMYGAYIRSCMVHIWCIYGHVWCIYGSGQPNAYPICFSVAYISVRNFDIVPLKGHPCTLCRIITCLQECVVHKVGQNHSPVYIRCIHKYTVHIHIYTVNIYGTYT